MKLLITNDDGMGAPGLELLSRAAKKFGEVTTVAPKFEQSGVSHRLSFDRPLTIREVAPRSHEVDGTPGDCVRVAIATLGEKFDWVLSGINDGANLGVEFYYSGTIAAAREARMLGIPSLAISQYRVRYSAPFDWNCNLNLVESLLEKLLASEPNAGEFYNINLPDDDPTGRKIIECKADMTPLPNNYVDSEEGLELNFKYKERSRQPGMDVDVCFGGDVSVTRHSI